MIFLPFQFFFLQLVCFYYVLTTFTTVGYGDIFHFFVPHGKMLVLNHINLSAGDIYATSEGERVVSGSLL